MLRKTLTILSLLGLLLSTVAWGLSYFRLALIYPTNGPTDWALVLERGSVEFNKVHQFLSGSGTFDPEKERRLLKMAYTLDAGFNGFTGFSTNWLPSFYHGVGHSYVRVPAWMCSVLFCGVLIAPLSRRRKRKKLGLCVKCGYDLRGSNERCTECGTTFSNQE